MLLYVLKDPYMGIQLDLASPRQGLALSIAAVGRKALRAIGAIEAMNPVSSCLTRDPRLIGT